MQIVINDDSSREIRYNDQDFTAVVQLIIDRSIRNVIQLPVKKIHFKNCFFYGGFDINVNFESLHYKEIEIIFEECFTTKGDPSNIRILGSASQSISISFFGCLINDLQIIKSKINKLLLSRVVFYDRFLLSASEVNSIELRNSLGKHFINEAGHNSKCNITFRDDNLFRINSRKLKEKVREICTAKQLDKIFYIETHFNLSNLETIRFHSERISKNGGIEKSITGDGKIRVRYYLTAMDANKMKVGLHINASTVTKKIAIKGGELTSLQIQGESDGKINIDHTNCSKIYIHNLFCKELTLYEVANTTVKEKSLFEIVSSDFQKASFSKVKFNSFNQVNFYKTILENVAFISCSFPKEIITVKNIHDAEQKEDLYPEMQYELYRQIKTSLLKNYNQVQALEMHRRMYNEIIKSDSLDKQDKFILRLNRVSNRHGTSIKSAALLSVALLLVLWWCFCLALPNAPVKIGCYGWNNFILGTEAMMKFLYRNTSVLFTLANPVHATSSLQEIVGPKNILTTQNYFFSFISRILIAWTFYQFISAFRKFGSKL